MASATSSIRVWRATGFRSNTEWTVGTATLGSPSPRPSPLGRGRKVHRLSITPAPEFAQRPSAKCQSDACCSLSLRERVRVRGNGLFDLHMSLPELEIQLSYHF